MENSRNGTGFMTMPFTMTWEFRTWVHILLAQSSEDLHSFLTLEEEELEDDQPDQV